jgi:RecJ-like exonuclease
MRKLCPTCGGKGTINDPKIGGSACYYNPYTGDSFPQALCQTCNGSGWVEA